MLQSKQTTLANLPVTRHIVQSLGGGVKKSLGQNFLVNQKILLKFINLLDLTKDDIVIEIGPGIGTISYTLCQKVRKLYLIELDREKEKALKKVLENFTNYEIIIEDASVIDYAKYFGHLKNVYVIGSLPYNLSKKIIYNLFNSNLDWRKSTFILQKEVAEHYTSQPPQAHFLGIFASIYSNVKLEFVIKPECFYPIPKVYSAAVTFTNKQEGSIEDNLCLSNFIKSCFHFPRKTILNNLKKYSITSDMLEVIGINPIKRPSEITLDQWKQIYHLIVK
ncbi:MAG: ribosomal RNA small subunit methyltransferase A [Candidatus Dojkabacteria bacterium]|nr:MAG: ribosomal RNA small subunit methyltransferase A [Candidatus Dojkabacteria bacterium]